MTKDWVVEVLEAGHWHICGPNFCDDKTLAYGAALLVGSANPGQAVRLRDQNGPTTVDVVKIYPTTVH